MNPKNIFLFLLLVFLGASCRYQVTYDETGLSKVQEMLVKKFGAETWYSEITILDTKDKGTLIRVKETSDVNSLQGKAWVKEAEDWIPASPIVFQFNDGKPKDHLFQLGKDLNLTDIADWITPAEKAFRDRGGKELKVNFISIQPPAIQTAANHGIQVAIAIQDQTTMESHSFIFDRTGKLLRVQN